MPGGDLRPSGHEVTRPSWPPAMRLAFFLSMSLALAAALVGEARAQVETDGTVGPASTLTPSDRGEIVISDSIGRRDGPNLFHSFATFDVSAGETAIFASGSAGIRNLIARVTGGRPSTIAGRLTSAIPEADLWLFNPDGVFFARGAEVDLPGSFFLSTASSLTFADGTALSSDRSTVVTTDTSPQSWSFSASPGRISLEGARLRVQPREALSLAAGGIGIRGDLASSSQVVADGGEIALLSVAGADHVTPLGGGLRAATLAVSGDISIEGCVDGCGQVLASVDAGARGRIRIIGGTLDVAGGTLTAGGAGRSSAIDVSVREDLILRGRGRLTATSTDRSGSSAGIRVDARAVEIRAGEISTRLAPVPIEITAEEKISLVGSFSRILSQDTLGRQADVSLRAHEIDVLDGAAIQSSTLSSTSGGAVELSAGRIRILGSSSTVAARTERGTGAGGDLLIRASDFELGAEAVISVSSFGEGRAGSIRIGGPSPDSAGAAAGLASTIVVRDRGLVLASGLSSNPLRASGAGGLLDLRARSIVVASGSEIRAENTGPGAAGSVSLHASDELRIEHGDVVTRAATGLGGDVGLRAGSLLVLRSATVTSSVAGGEGSGGNITLASPTITTSDAAIRAQADAGSGGDIRIEGDTLLLSSDSVFDASSRLGVDGRVVVSSPAEDLSNELVPVGTEFVEAADLLQRGCATRRSRSGSLTVRPRVVRIGRQGVIEDRPQEASADGTPVASSPLVRAASGDCRAR